MTDVVFGFSGEHRFLSNFFHSPIQIIPFAPGLNAQQQVFTVPTAEHLFQAHKVDVTTRSGALAVENILRASSASEAKALGRHAPMVRDWDSKRLSAMLYTVSMKFRQNPALASKLLDTGDAVLIEANHWGDTFWGVDVHTGAGENHLGRTLMQVRGELRVSQG